MRIAINTRFLLAHKMEGFGWYTYEIVKRMVEKHPEHTFLFFFDRPYEQHFIFGSNVVPIVLRPSARHPFLFVWWFEVAVVNALKKFHADVFFSPDGYLSLRSKTPQIGVIHDLNFEHYPKDLPWLVRNYYQFFFPRFARKAAHLITVSETSKKDIIQQYAIPTSHITALWNSASELYVPIEAATKQKIRATLTNGNSYFLFVGSLHPRKNLKRLLKAYLNYQKEGGTYDVVIVGAPMWSQDTEISQFQNKKIHFKGYVDLENLTQIMGAAACLVYVPYFEGFGIPLVEAMKCGIPIIAGNTSVLPEVAGSAALYVDPFSEADITQKLHLIANDTDLRNHLSSESLLRSELFDWNRSADQCFEIILRVANTHLKQINASAC